MFQKCLKSTLRVQVEEIYGICELKFYKWKLFIAKQHIHTYLDRDVDWNHAYAHIVIVNFKPTTIDAGVDDSYVCTSKDLPLFAFQQ